MKRTKPLPSNQPSLNLTQPSSPLLSHQATASSKPQPEPLLVNNPCRNWHGFNLHLHHRSSLLQPPQRPQPRDHLYRRQIPPTPSAPHRSHHASSRRYTGKWEKGEVGFVFGWDCDKNLWRGSSLRNIFEGQCWYEAWFCRCNMYKERNVIGPGEELSMCSVTRHDT